MERIKSIDFLKLIVILVIVLNHSIQYKWNGYKILSNDFQNPTLMFLSGLIFSYCVSNLGKYKTFKALVINKIKRIIVPLFLTMFLYYIPLMQLVKTFYVYDECYNRPLFDLVYGCLVGVKLDHLWFIYSLFIGVACVLLLVLVIYWVDYKTSYLAGSVFQGTKKLEFILCNLELIKQFCLIYIVINGVNVLYDKVHIFSKGIFQYLTARSFHIYLFHQPLVHIYANNILCVKTRRIVF